MTRYSLAPVKCPHLIELKAVQRRHDSGVLALDGLNLKLARGEVLGVLGPAGCGKSTLLRVLAGTDRPSAGAVLRSGESTHAEPTPTSFVFASAALMPWADVAANVELPLRQNGGGDAVQREQAARLALSRVGLLERSGAMPRELSAPERMRVALARALVTDPDLLLLDDWLAQQDIPARAALLQCLADSLRDAPRTVALTTTRVEDAVWLCDRVIVLSPRPGRVLTEVRIDAPAQRDAAFRDSPAFAKACARLQRHVADQRVAAAA